MARTAIKCPSCGLYNSRQYWRVPIKCAYCGETIDPDGARKKPLSEIPADQLASDRDRQYLQQETAQTRENPIEIKPENDFNESNDEIVIPAHQPEIPVRIDMGASSYDEEDDEIKVPLKLDKKFIKSVYEAMDGEFQEIEREYRHGEDPRIYGSRVFDKLYDQNADIISRYTRNLEVNPVKFLLLTTAIIVSPAIFFAIATRKDGEEVTE